MLAFAISILLGVGLGLRFTFAAFLPLMMLGLTAALAFAGPLAGLFALVGLQTGYAGGILVRAFLPALPARRPALVLRR